MARGAALLLGLALVIGGAGHVSAAPQGDGTDHALQREMERLYALRTQDPQAFVAQSRSLESLPLPANLAQREYLQFLRANRATLEGRFDEAIALSTPLADEAEDPKLRLRAGAFVVNMKAGTREFEEGLRRLGNLLRAHAAPDPALVAEQRLLWGGAAIFYHELGQYDLSLHYADRVLAADPPSREACGVGIYRELSRLENKDPAQTEADFLALSATCQAANEGLIGGFATLAHARFLRSGERLDEALALLESRLGAIDSTRYPRLTSEAYALDAELLLAGDRVDMAERQARQALALAKDLPTSSPVAMAEKVLYEIARRRGDSAAALGHLQRHVAVTRALDEESRIKDLAFQTVQHETLQREQALQLLAERNRVLDLQAQVAKAESRDALLMVALLGLGLIGMGVWAWQLVRQEARLRRLSQTDALTGFANRLHFTLRAERALAKARKRRQPLVLVTFDLDHFKQINDRHGHLAGDAVLREVSAAVAEVPVDADVARVVGRIGGEEFAVLLEGATPEQGLAHAEACRQAIAKVRARVDSGEVGVTASFGMTATHEETDGLHELMANADRALYRAKSNGRDRVIANERNDAREAA